MLVTTVESEFQIGGGGGWVAGKIADAQLDTNRALTALKAGWSQPGPGLHPREAALAAAREAVLHLNEALSVEAPDDAIEETRHALEELTATIGTLDKLGNKPIDPGALPLGSLQKAIDHLVEAESRLREPTGYGEANAHGLRLSPQVIGLDPDDPNAPHIMGDNSGIVPPWLQ